MIQPALALSPAVQGPAAAAANASTALQFPQDSLARPNDACTAATHGNDGSGTFASIERIDREMRSSLREVHDILERARIRLDSASTPEERIEAMGLANMEMFGLQLRVQDAAHRLQVVSKVIEMGTSSAKTVTQSAS